ncbi:ATP phosphoribosyltransferase regulatory subunit [Sporolactobacillus spathodeae]|uniref:ATP phosphoribosyltransferase regulatory subunit n=1 Tax=Sporolactobacillus spathodeae TaxID=1465502 RepID=A0ABS2QB99_9BACL|nr:ATP phosphoribosyltransferase regulatory subunit [Sporolactobacillus spathodeae]MBM7659008.1 ATP phosphoribosyltransferase regulatory subunit [Sporolactobacillus spathodeae]
MTKPYMFEKPLGLRDSLPATHREIARLEGIFQEELQRWGYDFLQTPALEYAETIGRASAIEDSQLFKFLDAEGHPVVLRPDMTTPIARIAASSLGQEPLPLRLAYTAALYRSQKKEGGHPSEFEQAGAELIGDATPYADAEVISLMMVLLEKAGLQSLRLAIGHVGFVKAFFQGMAGDPVAAERLSHLLYVKNDVGFRECVASLCLNDTRSDKLNAFIDSRRMDNEATLDFLSSISEQDPVLHTYYSSIAELVQLLRFTHMEEKIDLDITLMPHLSYYTGFVFQGFGGSLGFPVASGGRYDNLLAQFNRPCPATGFGIRIDRLMSAVHPDAISLAKQKMVIIYDQANAEKAMTFAQEQRERGLTVVLQYTDGIKDYVSYVAQFQTVYRFVKEDTGLETKK